MKEKQLEFEFVESVTTKRHRIRISLREKLNFVTKNIDSFVEFFEDENAEMKKEIADKARKEFGFSEKTLDYSVVQGFKDAYKTYFKRWKNGKWKDNS